MNAQRLREAMSAIPQLEDPEIKQTLWTVLQEAASRRPRLGETNIPRRLRSSPQRKPRTPMDTNENTL